MGLYSDESMIDLNDIETLVTIHARRLKVDPDVALVNALSFARIVGRLENDGKLIGNNIPQEGKEASSAKGLYQFVRDSVGPALNRVEKYVGAGWIQEAREHKDANRLKWNQQTLMFLGDMLEKRGSDKYMRRVLQDISDTDAVRDAYYVLHHTNPDEATKKRTEGILYGT